MSRAIWRSIDVDPNKKYRIQLCQDKENVRYYILTEDSPSSPLHNDCFYVTNVVDNVLLRKAWLDEISEEYTLTNGQRFFVDPHNIWLTESEMKQLQTRTPWNDMIWSTPNPPKFPPA